MNPQRVLIAVNGVLILCALGELAWIAAGHHAYAVSWVVIAGLGAIQNIRAQLLVMRLLRTIRSCRDDVYAIRDTQERLAGQLRNLGNPDR